MKKTTRKQPDPLGPRLAANLEEAFYRAYVTAYQDGHPSKLAWDTVAAEVRRIAKADADPHEQPHLDTVQHERWGVCVYVPRWWTGRRVRVEVIKEKNAAKCSKAKGIG
jgi:hypothetical protein